MTGERWAPPHAWCEATLGFHVELADVLTARRTFGGGDLNVGVGRPAASTPDDGVPAHLNVLRERPRIPQEVDPNQHIKHI